MSSKLASEAHIEATGLGFLYRQFAKRKAVPPKIRLTDQVAIVTGSNVGLGLEASRQLLQLGLSHLVMGVRSQAKGDAAASALGKEFPRSKITVWVVDLESYESTRKFADLCASLPRIDIAILNAGLIKMAFTPITSTGHETTLQVNYLSTITLAILLLPILKAKRKANPGANVPVLSIVSSDSAYTAEVAMQGPVLQQFDNAGEFSTMAWYAKSKLLVTLFTSKLAEFVSPSDVLINMVNPGMTKGTAFGADAPSILVVVFRIIQTFLARSIQEGASTYVDAAVSYGEDSHGSFISDWVIKP